MRMLETISKIRFLLPMLALIVSFWAYSEDQSLAVSVACIKRNCESSPMSCENNFLQSIEQLQCEQKRDGDSPFEADGFCSCISKVSTTLNGTGFTRLNERRVGQVSDLVVDEAMRRFAADYIKESSEFTELYFSALTSGFYQENELEALVMGKSLDDFNKMDDSRKRKLLFRAKKSISACAASNLYEDPNRRSNAKNREGICEKANEKLIEYAIEDHVRDADGQQGLDAFVRSMNKADISTQEARARFIQFQVNSELINNSLAREGINDEYTEVLQRFQTGQAVHPEDLPSFEKLKIVGLQRAQSSENSKNMSETIDTIILAINSDENSADYKNSVKKLAYELQQLPTYAKMVAELGGGSYEDGVKAFIRQNANLKGQGKDVAFESLTRQISKIQRKYFAEKLGACKERGRKKISLCRSLAKKGQPVHISKMINLNPMTTKDIAADIARREDLSPEKQASLQTELDVLSCVSQAPPASMCRQGTKARKSRDASGDLDFLDFTGLFVHDRHECTGEVSVSPFYAGSAEADDSELYASMVSREGFADLLIATDSITPNDEAKLLDAFTSDDSVEAGLRAASNDSNSAGTKGLFSAMSLPSERSGSTSGSSSFLGSRSPAIVGNSAEGAAPSESTIDPTGTLLVSLADSLSSPSASSTSQSQIGARFRDSEQLDRELLQDEEELAQTGPANSSGRSPASVNEQQSELQKQIFDLKGQLAKLKSATAKGAEEDEQLEDELEEQRQLEAEIEKATARLASLKNKSSASASKTVSALQPNFKPKNNGFGPQVLGPTPAQVESSGPRSSGQYGAKINESPVGVQVASSSQRSFAGNSSSGLVLVASGDGYFKISDQNITSPSDLGEDSFAKIRSELAVGAKEVVVEFPNGRRYVFSEDPETKEILQIEESVESIADLKRLDDFPYHQDDPIKRAPASILDAPIVIDPIPSKKWSEVTEILKNSGAIVK